MKKKEITYSKKNMLFYKMLLNILVTKYAWLITNYHRFYTVITAGSIGLARCPKIDFRT